MNWLALGKNNIPLIDLQVDKAIKVYQGLKNQTIQRDLESIEKLSEFQLSIKKRIKEMDQFYNNNCLDVRVRFLQGARLKLARLIFENEIEDKQQTIQLPWKVELDLSRSRNSISNSKKSFTPRKNGNNSNNNLRFHGRKDQLISPTPIVNIPISSVNQNDNRTEIIGEEVMKKKKKLQVEIPQNSPQNKYFDTKSFQSNSRTEKIGESVPKKNNTNRKLQSIPQKTNKFQNTVQQEESKIKDHLNQQYQAKIRTVNEKKLQTFHRNKPNNVTGKSRTLTEGNHANSIKKLNDLIFTIKMTKEDYEGFMAVKKQLNDGVR